MKSLSSLDEGWRKSLSEMIANDAEFEADQILQTGVSDPAVLRDCIRKLRSELAIARETGRAALMALRERNEDAR